MGSGQFRDFGLLRVFFRSTEVLLTSTFSNRTMRTGRLELATGWRAGEPPNDERPGVCTVWTHTR